MADLDALSLLRWIGGKSGDLLAWHLSLVPDHDTCVDHFGGAANFIMNKQPRSDIFNDNSGQVVNFWRVLRDQTEELISLLILTPVSRAIASEPVPEDDAVWQAWKFFVNNRQGFSGTSTGSKAMQWAISKRIRRERNETVSSWQTAVTSLGDVAARLHEVAIEYEDFTTTFRKYDSPTTFHYCDPPYWLGRDCPTNDYYDKPFTEADHDRLAKAAHQAQGKVLVCNYDTDKYRELYTGWTQRTKVVKKHAAASDTKSTAVESVWMNYDPADADDVFTRLERATQ